jgi:glutaredoxin
MSNHTIIVYSSTGCAVCSEVKEYLKKKGAPYTERNIVEDEAALDELVELGVMTTPATVIDGEVFTGFPRKTFEELLAR